MYCIFCALTILGSVVFAADGHLEEHEWSLWY